MGVRWNVTWTPPLQKQQPGKERLLTVCTESPATSRDPNRTRFSEVQDVIRVKTLCDKKTLLAEADTSNKRNLMLVRRHTDNDVDLCGEDNADANRQCHGKGQTMLTKPPSQAAFEECWSEVIIKNGLLLMILSFGRPLSQPLVWDNQSCTWSQGN